MSNIAKLLIIVGLLSITAGLLWHFTGGNIPLGKLPGDLKFKSGNNVVYIPITTCLLLSAILSLIGYFFRKF